MKVITPAAIYVYVYKNSFDCATVLCTWYSNTKMAKYKTIEINLISKDCIKIVVLRKKNKPKPLSFSASQ